MSTHKPIDFHPISVSLVFQTDSHVLEALYCGDEDVRSDAIALVCSTLKKAGWHTHHIRSSNCTLNIIFKL